jgi:hypothetical protein
MDPEELGSYIKTHMKFLEQQAQIMKVIQSTFMPSKRIIKAIYISKRKTPESLAQGI